MKTNDESWLALVDAFQSAAIDSSGWYQALERLAQATGSRAGELICIGAQGYVPLNILTNVEPEMLQAFQDCDGGNPDVNPRVRAGMNAPVLKVLAEADFMTPEEHARHPHYDEFARPWDIPYICLSTLERSEDLLVGLAVCRSEREGHITSAQREIFSSIAPHVRAAARTQMMLEDQSAMIVAGAMEALSIPAFICDRDGMVRALSPAAEALVRTDRGLQLKQGSLRPDNAVEAQSLRSAIELAARGCDKPGPATQSTVVLRGTRADASPLVLEVISLPRRQYQFNFSARVLVIVRGSQESGERKATILRSAYALTSAETDIAMQLAAGRAAEVIAGSRGVSIGTVRAQIKALMAKIGVSRQIELVARLNSL